MLSASHTLLSLPFGAYLNSPLLAFIGAFLLHFIADMFRHWNIYPEEYKRFPFGLVALDVGGGLLLAYLLLGNELLALPILAAVFGGNLPDILHSLWLLSGKTWQKKALRPVISFFNFHHNIQRETHNIVVGLLWQVTGIGLAVILLLAR